MSATTIARGIALTATTPTGTTGHIASTWRYTTHDPYAIAIDLDNGNRNTTWLIGRDLLTATLNAPAGAILGDGDLQAYHWSDEFFFNLAGPDASLLCHAPHTAVRDFLADTIRLVPPGSETRHVDIDALVGQLLGEVQP